MEGVGGAHKNKSMKKRGSSMGLNNRSDGSRVSSPRKSEDVPAEIVQVIPNYPTAGEIERMLLIDRGTNAVIPPNWEPLPHNTVFDENGLPNPDVIKFHFRREGLLSEEDALEIITRSAMIFKEEPNVVRLTDPVVISGDIHGQYYDLLKLLEIGGDPANQKYIFLGDYVDRGCFGMEIILLLMAYKIRYPTTFIMLRGNHESRHLTAYFNFKREAQYKYSLAVYNAVVAAFDCLPLVCILNKRFLCVHGGLSPDIRTIEEINAIHRFRESPSSGPMCDLLWTDPMDENEGEPFSNQLFVPNTTRGCSYVYSHVAACRFLEANDLLCIIRGHEAQDEGYRLFKRSAKGFPAVICLFSAPNYCDTYDNRAAIIVFSKTMISIRQFTSSVHPYYLPNFMNAFTWSLPFVAEKVMDIFTNILHLIDSDSDTQVDSADKPQTNVPDQLSLDQDEAIRAKIKSMENVLSDIRELREKNEATMALKGLASNAIDATSVKNSSEAVKNNVIGFKESKRIDMPSERWPKENGEETK